MLAQNSYSAKYLNDCRKSIRRDERLFAQLPKASAEFEHTYFNNLAIVLETMFVHRTRALEKKDGNPLNEVRLVVQSLISNGGQLLGDSSIKLKQESSVLGYATGDKIALTRKSFGGLQKAFFADLEAKYLGDGEGC